MKRNVLWLTLFIVLCTVSSFAQKDMGKYKSEIQNINDKLMKAMVDEDYKAVTDIYTEDAVSLPSYQPMLKGKKAIKAQAEKDSKSDEMKLKDISFNTMELYGTEEMMYEIGTYKVELDMKDMKDTYTDEGKYISIWVKDGNEWKLKADMWNTDNNPWQQMQNDKMMKDHKMHKNDMKDKDMKEEKMQ